jgi:hypothetical protein
MHFLNKGFIGYVPFEKPDELCILKNFMFKCGIVYVRLCIVLNQFLDLYNSFAFEILKRCFPKL